MSDHAIILIPDNPYEVPAELRQLRAREHFRALAPESATVTCSVSEGVRFFDCGENFERILCPACRTEIPIEWWSDWLDQDRVGDAFTLQPHRMYCCNQNVPLDRMIYERPQGFARFALEAQNPNISELSRKAVAEFETILGTRLTVIYQHY